MKNLRFLIKEIWQGKSVMRAFLNWELCSFTLRGKTIDVGAGKDTHYLSFMKKDEAYELLNYDVKTGAVVDFEKDRLPINDESYDTVLFLNVMEHVFNYQHIANEVVRIIRPGGQLIGFVPFVMPYHADPHDFFRYTHEALERILRQAGAGNITVYPVHKGPFIGAGNLIVLWFPRLLRIPLFLILYFADVCFMFFRKLHGRRYPVGYMFIVKK